MEMTIQSFVVGVIATVMLIFTVALFWLAEGSKGRHPWLCPRCGRWFDRKGRPLADRPIVAKFKFYAEGTRLDCSERQRGLSSLRGDASFAD